ncbi:MAG: DUF2252 family protein [Thiohalocapsa sp.]
MITGNENNQRDVDQVAAYREFAQRTAKGELLVSPTMLPKQTRRLHVRRTLREDHRCRIRDRPEAAQANFVRGYLDGLTEFARDDSEKSHQQRLDNSPPMIAELLESAMQSRKDFLADLIDLETGRFLASDEVIPHADEVDRFQQVIDSYRDKSDIDETGRAGHFIVKDVALKKGSGTASLGLDRYFVLIDGGTDQHTDDIVLELKQARLSALHGLVPDDRLSSDEKAERIVASHDIHLAGGDPYYGQTEIDGVSFLVRERSPYKDDIDVDALNKKELKAYARICGRTLAQPHARSDEDTGIMDGNAERRILASINLKLFVVDTVRFAETASHRIYCDFALFKKDHSLGAFQFVE